jgi:hypothetical protein
VLLRRFFLGGRASELGGAVQKPANGLGAHARAFGGRGPFRRACAIASYGALCCVTKASRTWERAGTGIVSDENISPRKFSRICLLCTAGWLLQPSSERSPRRPAAIFGI